MMNRRQKRVQIIEYFLRVAQAQEEVQSLQNDLISHLRFNPAAIFKKIGSNGHLLPLEQLRHYIQKHTGVTDREVIRVYMEKHHFEGSIAVGEFAASLLPYTPNVLREASDKIEKQMQTKHVDRLIEGLYQKLLEAELRNIYEISLFQKNLALDWAAVARFIHKDLKQNTRTKDAQHQPCDMVTIRRWLEIWVELEEYKVLNMMRWFGGPEEAHLQNYYSSSRIQPKCTCPSSQSSKHHPSSLSKPLPSSPPKHLPSASRQGGELKKAKSTPYLGADGKQLLKSFVKYVETIVKSERRLQLLREGLRAHKREVELILHEITSKKNNFTRLGKIIVQAQKALRIKPDMVNKLLGQLEHSKVDNSFLFSLYAAPSKKTKPHRLTHEQILTEVYEVLYTFCLSKATLKSIARDLREGADTIFSELDEHRRSWLDKADLKAILRESSIRFKEEDLSILMSHLGDGERITPHSLREVFEIQSCS